MGLPPITGDECVEDGAGQPAQRGLRGSGDALPDLRPEGHLDDKDAVAEAGQRHRYSHLHAKQILQQIGTGREAMGLYTNHG